MQPVHEVATITSKGQITLPKPIRQALGVDYGGKVAFDLLGSQVIVTRVEDPIHEDSAVSGFLTLLENDLAAGRHVSALPSDLFKEMQRAARSATAKDSEIAGEVAL